MLTSGPCERRSRPLRRLIFCLSPSPSRRRTVPLTTSSPDWLGPLPPTIRLPTLALEHLQGPPLSTITCPPPLLRRSTKRTEPSGLSLSLWPLGRGVAGPCSCQGSSRDLGHQPRPFRVVALLRTLSATAPPPPHAPRNTCRGAASNCTFCASSASPGRGYAHFLWSSLKVYPKR